MGRFTGNVPEDMVINILLRLDIKTLVGLKLVSKTWFALISSPQFAKAHLAITAAAEKEKEVHIVHTLGNSIIGDRDSISLINMGTSQFGTPLNFPLLNCSFRLVGSACGIVCISAETLGDKYIYLWNPATNLYKPIPSCDSPDSSLEQLGFGFDEIDDDFKIVRVVGLLNSSKWFEDIYFEVYSSKKNAWQKVEQDTKAIGDIFHKDRGPYVSVEGGLLCFEGCFSIITFDLHTEVFNFPAICYPVQTFEAKINTLDKLDARSRITNFNDSIAVIGYNHTSRGYLSNHENYKLKLWALDDKACLHGGGIQPSWTLIYDIDVKMPLDRVHSYLNIGYFLLSRDGEQWCLYSPNKEYPRSFFDRFHFGPVLKYTKSLFRIPGFKLVNRNAPLPAAD